MHDAAPSPPAAVEPADADAAPAGEAGTPRSESVPFVVGRLGREGRRLVVLDETTPPPIAGPFELREVFSR
jgi:hypothetical protein